jgi:predicted DCC family thiol-disulfide oxidoreductase YuxK
MQRSVAQGLQVATPRTRRRAQQHMASPTQARRATSGLRTEESTSALALFADDARPVILYDGVCGLCNRGVNFVLLFDRAEPGEFRLSALQSPTGRSLLKLHGRSPDDLSTIVLVEPDGCYTKSTAVLRIGRRLRDGVGAFRVLASIALLMPLAIRDTVYDWVALNRYRFFGKLDECRLSDAGRYRSRFVE